MANPRSLHFDVQVISRGQGKSSVASASYRSGKKLQAGAPTRSAIAAASYRSGETLYDEQEQKTFDYTRKEDIRHSEIITPVNAPAWAKNRQDLWNTVEKTEKRKDAQLARDVIAVFPRELNIDQCKTMIREYVNDNFVSNGMIADFSIHEADASDGGKNPHAHIMLTMREIGEDGFGKKNREWNDQKLVTKWRGSWETYSNQYLEMAGYDVKVTLQSYENLGIEKVPGVHMGAEQWNLEQKGEKTRKGTQNRGVKHENVINDSIHNTLEVESDMDEKWDAMLDALEPAQPEPLKWLENESLGLGNNGSTNSNPDGVLESVTLDAASDAINDSRTPATSGETKSQQVTVNRLETETTSDAHTDHYRALNEYVESGEFDTARKQTERLVTMKHYASRFVERTRELAGKAYQQFASLMRETIRERDRDKGHER